jgi:hypothetical protein
MAKKDIKLNVDLKKYLDHNLAKDNIKLLNELEKANKKIQQLEEQNVQESSLVYSKKDKDLKKINDKLAKLIGTLDRINIKRIKNNFKKLLNIDNIKFREASNIIYELCDSMDGELPILLDGIQDLMYLCPSLDNYLGTLQDE